MSAYPDHDPEYLTTFDALILGRAEETLAEHAELVEHGFRLVEVVGSPMLLYERGGKTFTRDYALAQTRTIKEDLG